MISSQLNVIRLIRRVCIGLWIIIKFYYYTSAVALHDLKSKYAVYPSKVGARVASKLVARQTVLAEMSWND